MSLARRVVNRLTWYYNLYIKRDPYVLTTRKWFKDKGDVTLRLNYPLTEESVVFDVGGYKGDWSYNISERYDPYIYIFEPIPQFYSLIKERFNGNSKVSILNFGLFDTTQTEIISVGADGSSIYKQNNGSISISLVDIEEFVAQRDISRINLIKINIEGAEYRLLQKMIAKRIIDRCDDVQVQFHAFYPNALELRNKIRTCLKTTHFLTYDYPFVWENWRKIN